jgi:HlyD family secretion protein
MNMFTPKHRFVKDDNYPSPETPAVTAESKALRGSMLAAVVMLLVVILLAALVPLGGAVIGSGQVGAESKVKRISHPIGGVVASVEVTNGEHVSLGQLLMRLDNQVSSADAAYSSLTVEQLLAQQSRLEAERSNAGSITFPAELTRAKNDTAQGAMADEQRLFDIRRQENVQLRAQLLSRIDQSKQNIRAIEAQISSLSSQRALIEPELRSVRELWDQKLVTISRVNQMERSAVELEGNIAAQRAQIAQVMGHISETQEQLIQMDSSRRSQAGEELSKINTALNDQRMRRVSATDQNSRSEIRAPYAGTIEKIAFHAVGEVIRPAEPIMEIVPDRDLMVVETSISPVDIDQVRAGQSARIRFSSFNRATTPEIPGRVVYVATDRTDNPEAKQSFYMVRVAIDQQALRNEKLDLRSGMPAEVYVQTGQRSLLSYLTKPLRDQIYRSFKDN